MHVNVGGAREAVELAQRAATSCGAWSSTLRRTSRATAADACSSRSSKAGQSFRNVVEETLKARGEKIVRGAMDRLPIAVMRPATIVGDSRTGDVDRFDGPYLLILLVVTSPPDLALPLPGRGDESLDLVPIDWVARASVAASAATRERQAARSTSWTRARCPRAAPSNSWPVRAAPRTTRLHPRQPRQGAAQRPGLERIAKSPRAFLETLTTPVTYDARNADELLESLGVAPCPPLESYLDKLVEYVQERVRQRRARDAEDAEIEVEDPLG